MNNKKKIIIFSSLILVILFAIIYISYGFITSKVYGNETSKKFVNLSQVLKVEYSDGTEVLTSEQDGYFIPGSTLTKTFTVKNIGNVKLNFSINLKDLINNFERRNDLIYELYLSDTLLITDTLPKTISNVSIAYNQTLNVNESKTYKLKIKYIKSDENQIIDQGKTISASISFVDQEKNISNIKILGNSIQNGTPSPATPVEIESVGDKSKNLLDINDFIVDGKTIKIENGLTWNEFSSTQNITINFTFKANTTYTLSGKATGNMYFGGQFGGEKLSYYVWLSSNTSSIEITNTTDQDITRTIFCRLLNGNVGVDSSITNLQLEEGTKATEYEPYYEGVKIPINVSSKNLLNMNNIKLSEFTTNLVVNEKANSFSFQRTSTKNTAAVSLDVYLKQGDYVIKGDCSQSDNGKCGWGLLNKENLSYIVNNSSSGAVNTHFSVSESKIYSIRFFADYSSVDGTTVTYSNIQLESGNIASEYDPYVETKAYDIYLDEPLRSVGTCENCSDYIDFSNRKIVRNVGKHVFSTNDKWTKGATATTNGFYRNYMGFNPNMMSGTNVPGLSNVLQTNKEKWNAWSFSQLHLGQVNSVAYLGTATQMTSDVDIYNYLSNNGINNPYVLYQMASSDLTDIEIPGVSSVNPNSNITIGTDIPATVVIE